MRPPGLSLLVDRGDGCTLAQPCRDATEVCEAIERLTSVDPPIIGSDWTWQVVVDEDP